ncbi:MAG: hypothetical protein JHC33_08650 [Ignisphaera sp.]|nr:hypothetical protein [Ignisphaera sp.]
MEDMIERFGIEAILESIGKDKCMEYFDLYEGLEDFDRGHMADYIGIDYAKEYFDLYEGLDDFDRSDMADYMGSDYAKEYFSLFSSISDVLDTYDYSDILENIPEGSIAEYLDVVEYINANYEIEDIVNIFISSNPEDALRCIAETTHVVKREIMEIFNIGGTEKASSILKAIRESYYLEVSK